MLDVVVVGGGIAGLAAAHELQRQGLRFVLVERAGRPGGVILSEQIDGFTIDAGPDSLLVQKRDAIALCEELGLASELVPTKPPHAAYIQRGGRLHPLPAASVLGLPTRVGPFLASRLFSWRGKLRIAAELVVPPRRDGADESIGAFIRRRFGAEAVAYLAEPLLAGIHAGDVDRLSIKSLFPRLVDAEQRFGSVLRAFHGQARRPHPSGGAFRSLAGGLSRLVEVLAAQLPAGTLHLNTAARRVDVESSEAGFVVELDRERLRAASVILATPAYTTARLVSSLDERLGALCRAIPYASTATIALAFRRQDVAHPLDGSGFVVPRVEGSGILAASWLSSKWPHRAPAGFVLLRTFVGGARDPRALDLDDAALIRRSLAALTPLVGIRGEPVLTRVYRWDRSTAQHEVGHASRLAEIEAILRSRPGLFVTGSGFRGVGIPDCVADGRATARQAARYLAARGAVVHRP